MFIQIFDTWTIIYVLLPLLFPTFSLGADIDKNLDVVKEPKTMYDAVVSRCPNLEDTDLKDNKIFTSKCLKWEEINATNSLSVETKGNVGCLMLYEALVLFCTNMGDTLHKVQGLIPTSLSPKTSNYTINKVCEGTSYLYSSNKMGHNISNLIRNIDDCSLLCLDFSEDRISDVCKYAYYFASFDVDKFTRDLENKADLHSVQEQGSIKNNSNGPSLITNITKQVQEKTDKEVHDIHANLPALKPLVPKPEHTENDSGKKNGLDKSDHKQEGKPENESVKIGDQSQFEDKIPVPPLLEPGTQNISKPVGPAAHNAGSINVESPHQPIKAAANPDNSPPEAIPEKDKKPELKEKQADPEEYDVERDEEEGEQEDNEVKNEIPGTENNEPKTSAKKVVKPSTVEDEGINNFNTPEDDMDGDSYFFSYFTVIMCLCIVGYVGYHNRQKILALLLEGKRGRRPGRGRRPNSANYHKLDTNLEEAISSSCTKGASNVIY